MLKEKHLVVVRAALKFVDEELSPSGIGGVSIEDVRDTRKLFNEFDLFYALVDSAGVVVESERLLAASSDHELNFQSDLSFLASVLVPTR